MIRSLKREISSKGIILAFVIAMLMLCIMPLKANAAQDIITGFGDFSIRDNYFYIAKEDKPSSEELIACMPETLEVYLNNSKSTVFVPVTWFCIEADFDNTDCYYYQFSPKFDAAYEVAEGIDIYTDAPYVGVFLQEAESMFSLLTVTTAPREQDIFDYLTKNLGYSVSATCGIMANVYCESSFYSNNLQNSYNKSLGYTDEEYTTAVDNGTYTNFVNDKAGYGLCQWTYYTRKQELLNNAKARGVSISNLEMQLDFLHTELKRSTALMNIIKSAANSAAGAYEVAYHFCYSFERPAGYETVSITRGNLARDKYWAEYGDKLIAKAGVNVSVFEGSRGCSLNYALNVDKNCENRGYSVKITYAGKEDTYNLDDGSVRLLGSDDVTNCFMFSVPIALAQQTDMIKLSVYETKGNCVFEDEVSVASYLQHDILENKTYESTWIIARQMLNLGTAAQLYFNYNTDKLANAGLPANEKQLKTLDEIDFPQTFSKWTGEVSGLSLYGSSLVLKSQISLRHYFCLGEGEKIDDYQFICNGKELIPSGKDGIYFVDIENIGYHQFTKNFALEIKKGEEAAIYDYSVAAYVTRAKAKGNYSDEFSYLLAQHYLFSKIFN